MNDLIRKIRDWAVITATGITLLAGTGVVGYSYFTPETVRTRITDAQMVKVDGRYMIATEYRPFVNHDAWYRGKFSSGSVQNEAIKLKGKQVDITIYGWRNPIFSEYENITEIKEVK